jgi:enamine deaminase RidA (YjgF/YER057c/UK114 family)
MDRKNVSSGSYLEPIVGFSRAVGVGPHITVAGTAPIKPEGGTACVGDVAGQTRRCLEIIEQAILDAGGELRHVVRTRIMITNADDWEKAARVHGEFFADIRPATTIVVVSGFVDPLWLVELEADCIVE